MIKLKTDIDTYFEVPLKLVTKIPDSKLAKICNGKIITPKDKNGAFIINEKTAEFNFLLQYLENDRRNVLDPFNNDEDINKALCL